MLKKGRKLNALSRILPHMKIENRQILMKYFLKLYFNEIIIKYTSQLIHYPLVWMVHSSIMNNKTNHLHNRCLHIACSNKKVFF